MRLGRLLWARHGSADAHEELRRQLAAGLEVFDGPLDLDLSKRFAAKSALGACYWNAARALLSEREMARGVYVEGLVCFIGLSHIDWKDQKQPDLSLRVGAEWQGWTELDGRVVDPTSCYQVDSITPATRPIYLPFYRASRDEVGDRWGEIPLTLSDPSARARTFAATDQVLSAYIAAARRWLPMAEIQRLAELSLASGQAEGS